MYAVLKGNRGKDLVREMRQFAVRACMAWNINSCRQPGLIGSEVLRRASVLWEKFLKAMSRSAHEIFI